MASNIQDSNVQQHSQEEEGNQAGIELPSNLQEAQDLLNEREQNLNQIEEELNIKFTELQQEADNLNERVH